MQIFHAIRDYDRRKNLTNVRRYTCLSWRSPVYVSSNHPVIRCNFIQASTHSRHPVCPHSMTPVCRSQNFSGLQPWTCNETVPRSHPISFSTWSKHRLFFSRSNRLFSSPIGTLSLFLSLPLPFSLSLLLPKREQLERFLCAITARHYRSERRRKITQPEV